MVSAFNTYRNYRISCIAICQYGHQLPPRIPNNSNLLLVFKMTNAYSIQGVNANVSGIFSGLPFKFIDLYNAFVRPFRFNYLMVNTDTEKVVCVMFNERGGVLEFDAIEWMKRLMDQSEHEPTVEDERIIGNDSPMLRLAEIAKEMRGATGRQLAELKEEFVEIAVKNNITAEQVKAIMMAASGSGISRKRRR
jgi:hypothetical protein